MMAAGAVPVPVRSGSSLRVHPSSSSANVAASSSSSLARSIFRVFCKGMVITDDDEVVGLADEDPSGVPVLAVAVSGPQGKVVLRGHKPVLGFVGGHDDDDDDGQVLLEAMAIVEGLHTAIRLGIASVKAITDPRLLHNYMLGLSCPTGEKLVDMISQALSVRKQFKQCEISLAKQGQVGNVVKLAKEGLNVEIARYLATKDNKRESCKICFDDVDATKIHAVEGCSHRFCLPCMKKHMEVMLLRGMAPRCPQLGCTTKLTMEEGSKALLPSRLLEMMAQRVKEEHIHPSQRIYYPYPRCSALMSLSEVQAGSLCSKYLAHNNAATLRKCVKCGGPMCVTCKVAWHERMSCLEYQRRYPHGGSEGERLQKLARQRQWKQCERCNHMIEHTTGCAYITCVCGNHLCYICGKTLTEDGCACTELARRGPSRRRCFPQLEMLGLSRPTGEKLADMINQAQSMRKQFEQCEISLVNDGHIDNVVKLAEEGLDDEIARYLATKEKTESCSICFEDVDTTKFHVVEGCAHRFCLVCMKKHMEVILLGGMAAPGCPQLGCTTKLTVEGSKALLSTRLLEIMAQQLKEEHIHIHPSQRIYFPYPKCLALMSLSEVEGSFCSEYPATFRECVKCGGPMCVAYKVAWHERMSCLEYQMRYLHGDPEGKRLHKLARRKMWKQCERCNHMNELAVGCAHIICVCGNQLCYSCGKTLAEDGSCACTRLAGRRRGGCFPLPACWGGMCR